MVGVSGCQTLGVGKSLTANGEQDAGIRGDGAVLCPDCGSSYKN